jgi:hypothetical protein
VVYTTRVISGREITPPVGALVLHQSFSPRKSLSFFHTFFVHRLFGMPFNDERVVGGNGCAVQKTGSLSVYILLYSRRDFTLFKEGQTEKNKCI